MSRPGWIKVWRKLQDNEIWGGEVFSRGQAWIDILLRANFQASEILDHRRTKVTAVQPGEAIVSVRHLARDWRWSKGRVRRFLDTLTDKHMIEHAGGHSFTRIKVLNWKKLQGNDLEDEHDDGHEDGHDNEDVGGHASGHASGHARGTPAEPIRRSKEGKEGKEDKNNTMPHVGAEPGGALEILGKALGRNGDGKKTNDRGDPAYLSRAKDQIPLFRSEVTQHRMQEFLGYLENNEHMQFKRIEEIVRKLFALRESLNMNDGVPADKIFCYAVDEAMKHDALQPSYVGTVIRNAVVKWREGALKF